MTTTQRIKYIQQSRCVVSEVLVESDELTTEELKERAKQLAIDAQAEAAEMTMRMQR